MQRRSFLQGAAVAGAPAFAQNRSGKTIGVASIGVGLRGTYLMQQAQAVPGVEIRVICDLYEGNRVRAKGLSKNPNVRIERDWKKAIEAPDVDAVIIATPDFWHAPITIHAAQAKKDIYVEKGWCIRLSEAKDMRRAVKENKVVMQLGHHYNSLPSYNKAREIYQSGKLGALPLVRIYYDHGLAYSTWKFYAGDVNNTVMPKDAGPATIDWERFIANAPRRSFDAERFFTWRCYWDYGTGLAGDVMSHQWDGVNMIVGMGIPEVVSTHGAAYSWPENRDVPDQWHVLFDYPKRKLAIAFGGAVHNGHAGRYLQLIGRDAALEVSDNTCHLYEASWKPGYAAKRAKAPGGVVPPEYSFKPGELTVSSHMENFFDCIRTRELPRCHVDRAFEEAATIVMSVEAYRKQRPVRWDPKTEEII
ncbi:MAG: Gfo/Idh/MocA family oxidoreductase [Acidobacteria bacterium]|nr:Gfo/Idh/MocA family oxidoreductase [Acidobacteriota bacterium]